MIYIVVRRTTRWLDEALFRSQLPAEFAPVVALWNATFSMPYHVFRHELKAIAQLNLSKVEGATAWA